MDKVIGWAFAGGLCCRSRSSVLCVSGRLSFELVQKAAVAGCPVLVAVGAPSSLAVAARGRSRRDALRLRARRPAERLHRAVAHRRLTGVLLVGGASRRFGSPKALTELGRRDAGRARLADARRGVRRAARRSARRRARAAVPAARRRSDVRAPIAGVVAGLRAAAHDVAVVPAGRLSPRDARARRCRSATRAATPPSRRPARCPARGRNPRSPLLERRLAKGRSRSIARYAELDVVEVEVDPALVADVDTPGDLAAL